MSSTLYIAGKGGASEPSCEPVPGKSRRVAQQALPGLVASQRTSCLRQRTRNESARVEFRNRAEPAVTLILRDGYVSHVLAVVTRLAL